MALSGGKSAGKISYVNSIMLYTGRRGIILHRKWGHNITQEVGIQYNTGSRSRQLEAQTSSTVYNGKEANVKLTTTLGPLLALFSAKYCYIQLREWHGVY